MKNLTNNIKYLKLIIDGRKMLKLYKMYLTVLFFFLFSFLFRDEIGIKCHYSDVTFGRV